MNRKCSVVVEKNLPTTTSSTINDDDNELINYNKKKNKICSSSSINDDNQYDENCHQHNNRKHETIIDWKNLPLVILYKIFSYLTPIDRLSASSTCHQWRMVIYHQTLWPKKHLKVNLCPHKFVLSENNCLPSSLQDNNRQQQQNNGQNSNESFGFHTYRFQDAYLYQKHLTSWLPFRSYHNQQTTTTTNNGSDYQYYHAHHQKQPTAQHRKPNRKNFNEQLKSFIQKCSRFLNGIVIYFDPNSSHNVLDLIKIIKYLSENELAIYELNETRQNYYANCRNLKYFSIVPVRTLVRCASDQRFISLYSGLLDAVRFLFSKCNQLEHVSLGELHELIHATDSFFTQFFKTGVHQKLECLHLSSIKGDIFHYIPQRWQTTLDHLEQFQMLAHLSLDFDVLNTKVINILSKLSALKTLSISVHHLNRNHPGIAKEAWERLVTRLPNLSVNLNLLHTGSQHFHIVIDSLLHTQMPLKHFRAYYLEFHDENSPAILCHMLDVLSCLHMETLQSVILVDYLHNPKRHLKAVSPNVLVMLSWRCRHLSNLTVIGYEITDRDIIAMARLRGKSLQAFRFAASCIQLSQTSNKDHYHHNYHGYHHGHYNNNYECTNNYELVVGRAQREFCEAVSLPLNRHWQPIPTNQIPIISERFLPQITYHRTIIEQSCQCKH